MELREANMPEEDINNLLEKRTKKVNPVINTVEANPTTKDKNIVDDKENKEKYSREELLNAAEIFCKFNSAAYYKDPEERKIAEERALVGLKTEHSEREIKAAIKVSGKRNELSGLKEQILRVKREYKDAMDNTSVGTLVVKAKYNQQIQDIKLKIRLIDNDYNPLLRELKIANLDSQLKIWKNIATMQILKKKWKTLNFLHFQLFKQKKYDTKMQKFLQIVL